MHAPMARTLGVVEELANKPREERVERLAIELERRRGRRPRELVAARHRRNPHLPHGSVRTDNELGGRGLFEDDLQDAVLKLDLEAFLVGERQQRPLCAFQCMIRPQSEILFAQICH